jgi:hypothetical protein
MKYTCRPIQTLNAMWQQVYIHTPSVHTHANLPFALPQSLLFSSLPRYLSQRSVGLEIEGCWVIFSCFPLTRQRWALSRPLPPGNSFHLRKKQKNFLFSIFLYFTLSFTSDAARHNRTCGKSTAQPHVRARVVNVR